MVGKCHCIVVTSKNENITAFYNIVKVYKHIYFTATFISYPHPSLHTNKRAGKATLIMSYQEIFNVKYRGEGGRRLEGMGQIILKVMYGGKIHCFYFNVLFFFFF